MERVFTRRRVASLHFKDYSYEIAQIAAADAGYCKTDIVSSAKPRIPMLV